MALPSSSMHKPSCMAPHPKGQVQVVAIASNSSTDADSVSLDRLGKLARDRKLDLVHWCRRVRVGGYDPEFVRLLSE